MEQYEEWPEEDQNFPENYPIQNIMVSEIPSQNQYQYRIRKFIPSNNISQEPQIYPSKGQIIQERNEYINYNPNNPNPYYNINNQINNNNHNLKIYYTSQNRDINKNSHNNDNLSKYESSDGVLRGYTNNFSFYESNSSKIKPKIITNASSQYNNSNNLNSNNLKYNYQRTNITQNTKTIYQNDINNDIRNRQIINKNENANPPYIIRVIEDEPVEYISPSPEYENNYNDMNFINDNNNENDYYYDDNENENENENRYESQNFRRPEIQRRMVKRVIYKQPNSQKEDYYIIKPKNNLRIYNNNQNIYRNNIDQINNYNKQNLGYRKIYSYDVNQGNELNPNQPLRRNNTPKTQYSNYVRPIKQIRYIVPNFYKNNYINESYNDKYSYKTFTEQNNDYIIVRAENNFPRNRSQFLGPSQNIKNNRNNEYIFRNQARPNQREYTSRTEQNQEGYDYEYEEDDDVYEVPEQYNKNNIINNNFNNKNRDYNEKRIQNNFSDRPFTRVKNYSQAMRNGKKYGVYTQTLEMNKNYYSNNDGEEYEYEYEMPNNMRNNRMRENYSQPKIMIPISDVQRLIKNKRDYSAFGRSLRNIRNNEEEIELENEERNNRIRSKANGQKNIRFISNNNGRPSREYKTFTQQQDNRTQEQGYILQDIDDSNFEDYESYQNQSNKNNEISPNEINERNKIQKKYIQGKDYYERAQMENMQNYDEQEVEEDDDIDGEGQMYDSSRLKTDKKDNFGIIQNNIENENINIPDINNEEVEQAQIQMNEGEMEEQRSIENDGIYRREEIPEDRDEEGLSNDKNLKNIETEICEKYYDNQGNYLGERKIITKNQIPKEGNLQQDEEYYEDQEEIEENENEYMPYQSSNKKFKKRGENIVRRKGPNISNDTNKNQNLKMNKESKPKYQSYYGDSNNNVYYEIKKVEDDSKNEKEIGNKKYKQPVKLVKNVTFGIHSENLCVPADDNESDNNNNNNNRESGKQRNTKSNSINDDKEADEQQIEENVVIEVDEEQNQVTLNQNDGNNNYTIDQNINENDNDNHGESENINENKNIESQNSEQNYNYNYIEENNLNNDDENNYQNYEENNNYCDENINNNEENINMNDKNGEYNMEYENEEERIYEENEGEEIENLNIQKDEGEEEDIGEDREQNKIYNYQQEQENEYEENQNYDEEGEEMEQREEYNIIEEDNLNKDQVNDNKEEN